jgi:hypothetical protein
MQVVIPSPKIRASATASVHVPFPLKFEEAPLVLATPFYRSPDLSVGDAQFTLSTFNVSGAGFSVWVERYDDRLPWVGMTVLASWIGGCADTH